MSTYTNTKPRVAMARRWTQIFCLSFSINNYIDFLGFKRSLWIINWP